MVVNAIVMDINFKTFTPELLFSMISGKLSSAISRRLKVYCQNYSAADAAVRLRALNEDRAVGVADKNVAQVLLHSLIYARNSDISLGQIYLGENDVERGGRAAYGALRALPIFGLTCELVASDHRPP